ncbi:MAG: hypothetical protein V4568_00095 [Pseudomonadota bacterium]
MRSLFRRKREPDPHVCLVEGGFDVVSPVNDSLVGYVRWNEVERIQAYKVDLLTTDCICLLFEFRVGKTSIQVSEEWQGFAELFTPMSASFPSIPPNWYLDVMTPAFERKQTILYASTHAA